MLLAEIMVRCRLVPASVRQVNYLWYYNCAYLVLSLHVSCSSQYAQMIFECRKINIFWFFLRNFLIFVHIGPYGGENFKTLLLAQFETFVTKLLLSETDGNLGSRGVYVACMLVFVFTLNMLRSFGGHWVHFSEKWALTQKWLIVERNGQKWASGGVYSMHDDIFYLEHVKVI